MLLWALVILPVAAGVGLLAAGRGARRVAGPAAVAVAATTTGLAVAVALTRPRVSAPLLAGLPAGLDVDGLSAVLVVVVAAVTLAVLVYAAGEFAADGSRWRFHGLMLVFAGAMLVTVTASTLPILLAAWEVMGATSYALIGYWHTEPRRVRGGEIAFVTTRTADVGLYLAAGAAVAAGVPGLRLDALHTAVDPWLQLIAAGVVAAALGKSAQLPFSFWLSRAMDGPSPVSALLHSATMVAAGASLLLRLRPLLATTGWAGPVVAWAGAATALVLGAVALAQRDLKQLLAASTCAQIGYMVLAAGRTATAGGALQLAAHAATKSLLFLCAGAWLTGMGTKHLSGLSGAARRHPLVGVAFTVGALSLAGVPPLSIWVAKDEILAGPARDSPALYAVSLAAAMLSAAYSATALAVVWQPVRPVGAAAEQRPAPITTAMRLPLPVLAAAAAGLAALGLPAASDWWHALLGAAGEPTPSAGAVALSGGLAVATVAVVLAAARLRQRVPAVGWLRRWLYAERLASAVVAAPVFTTARVLAAFDDRVVDGGVRAAAGLATGLSRLAGAVAEVHVDQVIHGLVAGIRRLGVLARSPQTGQLHQYYAQAVVALAVLVAILLALGVR